MKTAILNEAATTEINKRALGKPNEDRIFVDEEYGVFIMLDGVTRVHKEYEGAPEKSASGELGDLFIERACEYIKKHLNLMEPEKLLRGAVGEANAAIKRYREQKSEAEWGFYPSTLGMIAILRDHTLYYVNAGDCIAAVLRGNAKILFGCQWVLEALELQKITKEERYSKYCNHHENPLSYTVFNGDDSVAENVEYSFIDLHEGDTVILASDGIGRYVKYEKTRILRAQTPCEMVEGSHKYDLLPYAEYADDKSVIKIVL